MTSKQAQGARDRERETTAKTATQDVSYRTAKFPEACVTRVVPTCHRRPVEGRQVMEISPFPTRVALGTSSWLPRVRAPLGLCGWGKPPPGTPRSSASKADTSIPKQVIAEVAVTREHSKRLAQDRIPVKAKAKAKDGLYSRHQGSSL